MVFYAKNVNLNEEIPKEQLKLRDGLWDRENVCHERKKEGWLKKIKNMEVNICDLIGFRLLKTFEYWEVKVDLPSLRPDSVF